MKVAVVLALLGASSAMALKRPNHEYEVRLAAGGGSWVLERPAYELEV